MSGGKSTVFQEKLDVLPKLKLLAWISQEAAQALVPSWVTRAQPHCQQSGKRKGAEKRRVISKLLQQSTTRPAFALLRHISATEHMRNLLHFHNSIELVIQQDLEEVQLGPQSKHHHASSGFDYLSKNLLTTSPSWR